MAIGAHRPIIHGVYTQVAPGLMEKPFRKVTVIMGYP